MDRLPTDVTSALEMMRFGCPLDKPLGDPDMAYFERRMLKAADILEAAVRQSLSQEAVRDEVLEEAARVADALTSKWHTDYKIGHGPHRASAHREGMSDGAEEVAREIRSLKREPNAALANDWARPTTAKIGASSAGPFPIYRVKDEVRASCHDPQAKLSAAEAEVRKPCPLCGRTDPHSHTSGPLGMS